MCGIVGTLDPENSQEERRRLIQTMGRVLEHRGPDGEGVWEDQWGYSTLHRRLSVIDLSSYGSQPMSSYHKRFIITFNGEIYNYSFLRKKLKDKGYLFSGHSDTEVLVNSFEHWGFLEGLKKIKGMYAFSLWDIKEKTLYLARDPFGEKPLYYGFNKNRFLFASELKSFHAALPGQLDLDTEAIHLYLKYNYVPSPKSIYKNFYKLKPGHYIKIYLGDLKTGFRPNQIKYEYGKASQENASCYKEDVHVKNTSCDEKWISSLHNQLRESVRSQMVSDVPLGVFLSGGLDSSLITALAKEVSEKAVKAFSIGFEEAQYDESAQAMNVAKTLGVQHTVLRCKPSDVRDLVFQLSHVYDEPFSDSSQLPTLMLSQLTKKHVTVSLSGDGADEIFGGYNRYLFGEKIFSFLSKSPKTLRSSLKKVFLKTPFSVWQMAYGLLTFRGSKAFPPHLLDKIFKVIKTMDASSEYAFYESLLSYWPDKLPSLQQRDISNENQREFFGTLKGPFSEKMMQTDFMFYLPEDILVKVDRASMWHSLEVRAPFLDKDLVSLAQKIPMRYKVTQKESKWVLRQILKSYLPETLISHPKTGFSAPIGSWLRGDLREWAEELLKKESLESLGIIDVDLIQKYWREHIEGKRDWEYCLWNILMLQLWRKQWGF